MTKLENEVNTLLAYLREFDVVQLVATHYSELHNPAPAMLLRNQVDKVQAIVAEAGER